MRRVIVESPYAGDVSRNISYALECCKHSVMMGEAPFASHLFYTQFLDDTVPKERQFGMLCGFSWMFKADAVAVYTDRGISKGMEDGIKAAKEYGLTVEFRSLRKALEEQRLKAEADEVRDA